MAASLNRATEHTGQGAMYTRVQAGQLVVPVVPARLVGRRSRLDGLLRARRREPGDGGREVDDCCSAKLERTPARGGGLD